MTSHPPYRPTHTQGPELLPRRVDNVPCYYLPAGLAELDVEGQRQAAATAAGF